MYDATRIKNSTDIKQVEIHRRLESTNDLALELIRQNNIATPALIVAEHQTSGRGQRNRKWWSGEGSLTFSWIAQVDAATSQVETPNRLLSIAAALAVANAIESATGLAGIQVKWPNDLIVSGRKLCGILIESVSIGSLTTIVNGIGINVNNNELALDEVDFLENRTTSVAGPTSVLIETHQHTPLEDLLIDVVKRLQSKFESASIDPDSIVNRCNERLAFVGRKIIVVSPPEVRLVGMCEGIGIEGGLVLNTDDGVVTIYSGTISDV
jgi:BirA family biotin operon repressor/biotin-[acetyl-CoA-carboxylase] ligase